MINLNLKDFQEDAISFLLDKTNDLSAKKKIIIKSPTGSGKTIILISFVDKYLSNIDRDAIICWFTPGKGDLEDQSREKMDKLFPSLKTGDIHDVLLQGFEPGTTYFINWEMITNKKNNALKDTERKNLFNRISEGHRSNRKFIVIIDEEHMNNTSKADDVLSAISHVKEIRVSATTKKNPSAEYYEIPEIEVISSGLITKALFINENLNTTSMVSVEHESEFLVDKANEKRKAIFSEYKAIKEDINPLVIIQFPNTSDDLIKKVENKLESMGYTYNNMMVAKWLDTSKINVDGVTYDDATPVFLLMKQAISTGWDCPRAKVLVKLRENMSENFEIQTLGRLRRMPRAKHYDNNLLDFCYLYTFDERYKESVINAGNAFETKRLFLKEHCKSFTLKKELRNRDYQYVNEKEVLNKSFDFFVEKYKLTKDKASNQKILENNGYIFGTLVYTTYRSGVFRLLSEVADERKGEHHRVGYEVSTHTHGIDCLHAIDMIKKVISLQSNKTRAILQHLFHQGIRSKKKLISLKNIEWYAFMINNAFKLREDFGEVAAKPNSEQMQFLQKHEVDFKLPIEEFYRYFPHSRHIEVYQSNAYKDYDTSMTEDTLRSMSEQLFENFCEKKDDIEWVYKNGDSGQQYLSIVYGTNISKEFLFYPDYIAQKTNGDIWIIETKGGEIQGKSKNIDKQIENKFIAFKEYAGRHNVKWGFVRDKNGRLFINNSEYSDDMSNDHWKKLESLF